MEPGTQASGATVMGVFCLLIAAGVLLFSVFARRDEEVLAKRGVKVQGTVLAHHRDRDTVQERKTGRRDYDHYLEVQYFDQVPSKHFPVSQSVYNKVRNFEALEVIYDPENPRHAQLTGSGLQDSSGGFIISAVAAAVGLGFLGYGWKLRVDARNEVPDLDEALMLARRGKGR